MHPTPLSHAGVLLPGPSLTEGYPATNPSVRLLEFDAKTFELVDVRTYIADLHAGNTAGGMKWVLEYTHRDKFGMPDLSPASFAAAVAAFGVNGSATWNAYKGQGDGSLYCKGCVGPRPFSIDASPVSVLFYTRSHYSYPPPPLSPNVLYTLPYMRHLRFALPITSLARAAMVHPGSSEYTCVPRHLFQ
jgi:hypothetical protein